MARASEVLDSLRVHLERARRLLMSPPGRIREVLGEHAAIVAAIEAGDATAAREAMKRHLGVTGALLEAFARRATGTVFAVTSHARTVDNSHDNASRPAPQRRRTT